MDYAALIYGTNEKLYDRLGTFPTDFTDEADTPFDQAYDTDEHYEGFVVATSERNAHVNNTAASLNYKILSLEKDELKKRFSEELQAAQNAWKECIEPQLPDDVDVDPHLMLVFDYR